MRTFILVAALVGISLANEFRLKNNCPFNIWPGILGNPGKGQPEGGGFLLGRGQTKSLHVASNWAGRIWARTNCNPANGHCETGDCGNKIRCNGAGGVPPVTLAEILLNGHQGLDFYDISLVDGYNIPIRMKPINPRIEEIEGSYKCTAAGCISDLNSRCPNELAIRNGRGRTVACKSACERFNTDQYCCRGAYNTPQTCKPTQWPFNYAALFKRACPKAYSYAYDDPASTFTCKGNPNLAYEFVFCP